MPGALEVTDKRLKSTLRMQCNRSLNRNNDNRFPEDQLINRPVTVFPENRDSRFTERHSSDWKLAPFSSSIQEVNKASYSTTGPAATEVFKLLSPQPTVVYWLDQPDEKNMHYQDDSSRPLPNGGSTLGQHRHRKKVKNSLTTCPPCHVVANTSSSPVTAPLRSDSDVLHDDDKPPKRNSKKKVSKKGKQYRQGEKLDLLPEILCAEHIDAASPVEVLLPDLLAEKLSDTSSSTSLLVRDAHLGKDNGENNNEYVEGGNILTSSTLGGDAMGGSEFAGSANETVGERLSCNGAPYLNDGENTFGSSEFGTSTVTEHVCSYVGEERDATKDENKRSGSRHGASTGLYNVEKPCYLTGVHLNATCAGDSNDPFGSSSCCSKDVTDSTSHTERVQCSSEACSSKTFLPVSSGRSSKKSRKTSSCSNLTATTRVVGANRHRQSGKDNSVSVWQKVEKLDKENPSRAGRVVASAVQDTIALEDSKHSPNRSVDKQQCGKSWKQHSPDDVVETRLTKENDTLNSCQPFSRGIHKKQMPFQQTSVSPKKGCSQSPRNHYASKNGIPKTSKNHTQQIEGLPMLQPVCARDTSDRSISTSLADEFPPNGVVSNSLTEGNESSQSGVEEAVLASSNMDCHLVPQATSKEACSLVIQGNTHSSCNGNNVISAGLDSRNLCSDPCAAEMAETPCANLITENTSQESCKLYSAAGHMSHKWVPVGKKDMIHLNVMDPSVVEASVAANDISVSAHSEDSKEATEGMTAKSNSSGQLDWKCQGHTETGAAFSKIREAVGDAFRAQQRAEDIQLRIGRPLADFEQFIHSASPVLHCSSCPIGCNSYSQEIVRDGLCFDQTMDISLGSIWQWYEEPGCYGLEVKAQDLRRSKGFWNRHHQFTAYFVPYLSAVQLFGQPKRTINKEVADMDVKSRTSPCMNSLPILAKLLPQQSSQRSSNSPLHIKDDQQLGSVELIFEFFESEQPFWRRQLFDRVKELIDGAKQSNCQILGDPKNLELNLHDLHPASWYSVAWYPIYRIPDAKFQAAFLTYHSLGHWVHQRSSSDQAGHTHVVLPVMGLQSYNDKGESWFQMSKSGSDETESLSGQPSQILRERLSTLNQAAAAMARADVFKKDQMRKNRHPDYEFFLSRNR
ncbi:uncharacterized protein LOC100844029 [Brachypodium distachyon]|uniref:Uncharacterized protein n=1 Tax=Brachypodium distachyon TaxID=15368 RepID=A0A0Q3JX08_BRADI|nr:uncharacterized protein LOC100844029 [Brachypodium distachyon]XP_010239368.1 uncharacterized protein LOC100844029 [Brachypodium distachyon]XP_014751852.1 uncharacterized protein LOC100844029 [Brachypodium distachyon]KQK16611.1 hypothetical protein BRADI_1g29510v3 [Brachypodium distachyon]KQK16612.1 hypothetical protein BRADI_1g29510v3 [Brachypodium distachyon]KQK16613.1 hypothetical protein BRADI_1g29510v3 [Brachypodium distachyon]PNT75286.1 hypothetical protein BRADI_1g29510v3 [Brachypodi|eukprot:XP_010239363.1 uncharacterized protein LOC100844029 [Brachypodium distachyon]